MHITQPIFFHRLISEVLDLSVGTGWRGSGAGGGSQAGWSVQDSLDSFLRRSRKTPPKNGTKTPHNLKGFLPILTKDFFVSLGGAPPPKESLLKPETFQHAEMCHFWEPRKLPNEKNISVAPSLAKHRVWSHMQSVFLWHIGNDLRTSEDDLRRHWKHSSLHTSSQTVSLASMPHMSTAQTPARHTLLWVCSNRTSWWELGNFLGKLQGVVHVLDGMDILRYFTHFWRLGWSVHWTYVRWLCENTRVWRYFILPLKVSAKLATATRQVLRFATVPSKNSWCQRHEMSTDIIPAN